jgi:hypothetical protein
MTVNRRGHPIAIRVLEFGMRIGKRFKVSQSSFGVATLEDEDDFNLGVANDSSSTFPLAALVATPLVPARSESINAIARQHLAIPKVVGAAPTR